MNIRIEKNEEKICDFDNSRILLLLPSKDSATAEDLAMLQALYSRDPQPIDSAIRLTKTTKSGEFMNKFYVGYGHSSIGECGTFTLAIENVPMVIAKLIQHNPLYVGQECSTRYIDFGSVEFTYPSHEAKEYMEKLRQFYILNYDKVLQKVARKFNLDLNDKVEHRTAKAACFDFMRGFLPFGANTNLSWTTNFKVFNDHIARLRIVQDSFPGLSSVLTKMVNLVSNVFPNSVHEVRDDGKLKFVTYNFYTPYREFLLSSGNVIFEYGSSLDIGSWRDLARHRSISVSFPSPDVFKNAKLEWDRFYQEMHSFYLNNILDDDESYDNIRNLISEYKPDYGMYAAPLAFRIPVELEGYKHNLEYILKLRTSHTVHNTLRDFCLDLAKESRIIDKIKPENRTRNWTVTSKRGTQTIRILH